MAVAFTAFGLIVGAIALLGILDKKQYRDEVRKIRQEREQAHAHESPPGVPA